MTAGRTTERDTRGMDVPTAGIAFEEEKRAPSAAGTREGKKRVDKLVFIDGKKLFDLEDLLCASAEVQGKGTFGTSYNAVLEDGLIVAVKRLRVCERYLILEFEMSNFVQSSLLGAPGFVRSSNSTVEGTKRRKLSSKSQVSTISSNEVVELVNDEFKEKDKISGDEEMSQRQRARAEWNEAWVKTFD
ncbi:hypothetical protein L7F22_001389 [Adiantum nelumboides]|nr:hypothetical protein [Adiantum nelumboides]